MLLKSRRNWQLPSPLSCLGWKGQEDYPNEDKRVHPGSPQPIEDLLMRSDIAFDFDENIDYVGEVDNSYWFQQIRENPWNLRNTLLHLREDKALVLEAVRGDAFVLACAGPKVRADRELILEALSQRGPERLAASPLLYASDELKHDREVVTQAVKQNCFALNCACAALRDDASFVLELVKVNAGAFEYASSRVRGDKQVAMAAVRRKWQVLQHASETLRGDREVVMEAFEDKGGGGALQFASPALRADREVVLKAVQCKSCHQAPLRYADHSLRSDRDLVLEAVKIDGASLNHASAEFQNDPLMVVRAWRKCSRSIQFRPDGRSEADLTAAASSALACEGDEAPLVNVSLSLLDGTSPRIRCEATMLSGQDFLLELTKEAKMRDLALYLRRLTDPYRASNEAPSLVYLVIGDSERPVSPFDADSPLLAWLDGVPATSNTAQGERRGRSGSGSSSSSSSCSSSESGSTGSCGSSSKGSSKSCSRRSGGGKESSNNGHGQSSCEGESSNCPSTKASNSSRNSGSSGP